MAMSAALVAAAVFVLAFLVTAVAVAVVTGRGGGRSKLPPGPGGEGRHTSPQETLDYHAARSDSLRFQNPNQV